MSKSTANSTTTPPAASRPTALSGDLKAAVLAAADAHLAAVTADVTRLRDAVSHDLAGVAAVGTSEFDRLESLVRAEITRLRADLTGSPHGILIIGACATVASVAAVLGHFVVHLF